MDMNIITTGALTVALFVSWAVVLMTVLTVHLVFNTDESGQEKVKKMAKEVIIMAIVASALWGLFYYLITFAN